MASSGQPNAKEKKYDRQLRLWGANGQQALEASHIGLVNATATGCEVLKNLILPGVGRFTVIDDVVITEADLGVNFFVDEDGLGQSRAEYTCKYLSELNPDVQGAYINDSLANLMTSDPTFISTNSISHLLICSPLSTDLLHSLQQNNSSLAIFYIYSIGFVASLRISLPELCIVETHPDSLIDLRLFNPWPELLSFAEEATRDMDAMSEHQHGHIPYLALLLHYLEKWKQEHGGELPVSYQEKNKFKEILRSEIRANVSGGSEENWGEAIAAVLANVRPHEISSSTREVLEDERCRNLERDTDTFWIIARAVAEFVASPTQGNGLLPLSGGIPDMKAESKDYVTLQSLYRQKAAQDFFEVSQNVAQILTKLNRPATDVTEEEIKLWCKNANYVRRIRYRTLAEEWSIDDSHSKAIYNELANLPDSSLPIYIALRAYQYFYNQNQRSPGSDSSIDDSSIDDSSIDDSSIDDTPTLVTHARAYLDKISAQLNLPSSEQFPNEEVWELIKQWCEEITRYGGAELHNIASFAGGVVSQEVIKCMTRQYLPVRNTVVVDGVGSKCATWEL